MEKHETKHRDSTFGTSHLLKLSLDHSLYLVSIQKVTFYII